MCNPVLAGQLLDRVKTFSYERSSERASNPLPFLEALKQHLGSDLVIQITGKSRSPKGSFCSSEHRVLFHAARDADEIYLRVEPSSGQTMIMEWGENHAFSSFTLENIRQKNKVFDRGDCNHCHQNNGPLTPAPPFVGMRPLFSTHYSLRDHHGISGVYLNEKMTTPLGLADENILFFQRVQFSAKRIAQTLACDAYLQYPKLDPEQKEERIALSIYRTFLEDKGRLELGLGYKNYASYLKENALFAEPPAIGHGPNHELHDLEHERLHTPYLAEEFMKKIGNLILPDKTRNDAYFYPKLLSLFFEEKDQFFQPAFFFLDRPSFNLELESNSVIVPRFAEAQELFRNASIETLSAPQFSKDSNLFLLSQPDIKRPPYFPIRPQDFDLKNCLRQGNSAQAHYQRPQKNRGNQRGSLTLTTDHTDKDLEAGVFDPMAQHWSVDFLKSTDPAEFVDFFKSEPFRKILRGTFFPSISDVETSFAHFVSAKKGISFQIRKPLTALQVIQKKCSGCHSSDAFSQGRTIPLLSADESSIREEMKAKIRTSMETGRMGKSVFPRLTEEQKAALLDGVVPNAN